MKIKNSQNLIKFTSIKLTSLWRKYIFNRKLLLGRFFSYIGNIIDFDR
jgi:hypothetical protein